MIIGDRSNFHCFPGGNFFCQDYRFGPGVHLSKIFHHFSTNQILQCKQLHVHLLIHMKCVAGYHNLFVPPFFGSLSVLFSVVHKAATHKIYRVHLKHRKRENSFYTLLAALWFFPLHVKDIEFLIFHHHPVLLSSPCNNSQSTFKCL